MKKCFALLLVLSLIFCSGLALADTDITVQGSAQIFSTPDIANVNANATVTADTVSGAQEALSRIVLDSTDRLLAMGVDGSDIVTQNYSYYPAYSYEGPTPMLVGYQANHTLSITIRNLSQLDDVLSALTDCGMTEIYGVSYDLSNRAELYRDALVLAMQAAKAKAEIMAKAEGLELGAMESVTENGNYDGLYFNAMDERATASGKGLDTGIRSGSVGVTANVTAVYEAK